MMYSIPVTVVGLQLLLMETELSWVSTCFIVAMMNAWLAFFISRCLLTRLKPSVLIICGLLACLISSLLMIDYKAANTLAEKR